MFGETHRARVRELMHGIFFFHVGLFAYHILGQGLLIIFPFDLDSRAQLNANWSCCECRKKESNASERENDQIFFVSSGRSECHERLIR